MTADPTPPPGKIRVLLLEDNPVDAEINLRELRRAGFGPESTRVQTERDFAAAIEATPDLILSDYSLPQFDGLRALELLRERGLDIPFILISGTLGEEAAVQSVMKGADDYILKDRIARLGSAVTNALKNKRLRDERRAADEKFRRLAESHAAILDALPAHIALLDPEGVIVAVNEAWRRFATENSLQSAEFAVGQNYLEVCNRVTGESAGEAGQAAAGIRRILQGEAANFELEYACHSPTEQRWFRLVVTPLSGARREGVVVSHVNVTARRLAEEQIRSQLEELQRWQAVTLKREDRVKALKEEVNALLRAAGQAPRYGTAADVAATLRLDSSSSGR